LHERLDNDARYRFRDPCQLALEVIAAEGGERDVRGVDAEAIERSVHVEALGCRSERMVATRPTNPLL